LVLRKGDRSSIDNIGGASPRQPSNTGSVSGTKPTMPSACTWPLQRRRRRSSVPISEVSHRPIWDATGTDACRGRGGYRLPPTRKPPGRFLSGGQDVTAPLRT